MPDPTNHRVTDLTFSTIGFSVIVGDAGCADDGQPKQNRAMIGQQRLPLSVGDPAPWFRQRTARADQYSFDSVAGRNIVLCFLGSARDPACAPALELIVSRRALFDDVKASFFGISTDPADEAAGMLTESYPGIRFFRDFDQSVSKLYGVPTQTDTEQFQRQWIILDSALRIIRIIAFADDHSDIAKVHAALDRLPDAGHVAGIDVQAPIIVVPNVFEPGMCEMLIALYQKNGGYDSGFMRDVAGKTTGIIDYAHKRRRDYNIEDQQLMRALQARIAQRLVPQIKIAYQFNVTRMERYIVACYLAEEQAHFRAHRDNTTKGTAHRRFATTINLNAEFTGGQLCFPEFGPKEYKPAPGAALVFSCSMLHSVSTVTSGERFAFLPFLYDDAAAKIRQENAQG